jgi:hypothetical protein
LFTVYFTSFFTLLGREKQREEGREEGREEDREEPCQRHSLTPKCQFFGSGADMIARAFAVLLLVFLAITPAGAQERRQLDATRTDRAPSVDGRLDDEAWRSARWTSGFVQREPVEGAPAPSPTSVAVLFDDDAIYIGARMTSSVPVRALVTRRDREGSSEQLIVSLDSYHDLRTAYSFGVTAAGVRIDYFHGDDNRAVRDYTFDPVWLARTHRDSAGWTAEMRIPFTQLRFNAAAMQTWGVNVVRLIPALNEEDHLTLVRRNDAGWASRMGALVGLSDIRPSRRVELTPYAASDARLRGNPDPRNPFEHRSDVSARIGGDLKVGLGPNLTLDATFNPDFGQVEADPAEVNLSQFETFFSERRPFFVEGSQLLRANGAGWFYSRRVGAPPHLRAPGDFAEAVQTSTILGAAKITGRLASKTNVGIFAALTDRETARGFRLSDSSITTSEVEPRTAYGVARVQREFGQFGSNVGAILTGLHRDFDASSPSSSVLARSAASGALDWNFRTRNGAYTWIGAIGFGGVRGDSAAILRVQQTAVHYFQRPDASHVRLDPSRRSLGGSMLSTTLSKNAGSVLWQVGGFREASGLEVNDAGRLGSADDQGGYVTLRYRQTKPSPRYRNYELGYSNYTEWNIGGLRQNFIHTLFGSMTFTNFWSSYLDVGYYAPNLADELTRGGPLMGRARTYTTNFQLANAPASKTRLSMAVSAFTDAASGKGADVSSSISIRPGTQWELALDPRYSHNVIARQFVASLAGGSAATFGRRYVFSAIERSELVTRLRLNYAFTPDVTLETYLEPFVSAGRYYGQGELPAAGSYALRVYGTDGTTATRDAAGNVQVTDGAQSFTLANRDFTVRSLRSNVVTRWEWRPGSTLFLVWQQNRGASDPIGPLVRPGGLFDAFSATGDNFLAVKVSYWIAAR